MAIHIHINAPRRRVKDSEIAVTPHDVRGKMPRIEGTEFEAVYNGKVIKLKLTKMVDNRLYGEIVS